MAKNNASNMVQIKINKSILDGVLVTGTGGTTSWVPVQVLDLVVVTDGVRVTVLVAVDVSAKILWYV